MKRGPNGDRRLENAAASCYGGDVEAVDAYIADQPEAVQPLLYKVRETIRAAVPNAQEKISWRMPTYWQGENIIHFAAFKHHLGIYPGDLSLTPFQDRVGTLRHTKGAIQFPYDEPIDYGLIAEIAQWRAARIGGCASWGRS
ncbi:iron chaperone [Raoultibacter phocaeensis]|uniref:iron chaperone n=1 Tax=Raoultibacter phocaeensis TaxID=2479841 RepID=UPI001118F687|nr:DUF1801 domain-containing protein [Raoultibacter phocaeensis]